jgi:hypothetical protein
MDGEKLKVDDQHSCQVPNKKSKSPDTGFPAHVQDEQCAPWSFDRASRRKLPGLTPQVLDARVTNEAVNYAALPRTAAYQVYTDNLKEIYKHRALQLTLSNQVAAAARATHRLIDVEDTLEPPLPPPRPTKAFAARFPPHHETDTQVIGVNPVLSDKTTHIIANSNTLDTGNGKENRRIGPIGMMTYDQLQEQQFRERKDVDPSCLHHYLLPQVFLKVFGMELMAFEKLPAWRQERMRKDVRLF